MRARIRLLVTVVLLIAALFIWVSSQDPDLLLTAFRAAQAALVVMLSLAFVSTVRLVSFQYRFRPRYFSPRGTVPLRFVGHTIAPLIC